MGTIHVVGAGIEGQEGFSQRALQLLEHTDVIVGASKQLALFSNLKGEKRILEHEADVCEQLRDVMDTDVVVLASGDPLFSVSVAICYAISRRKIWNLSPM